MTESLDERMLVQGLRSRDRALNSGIHLGHVGRISELV